MTLVKINLPFSGSNLSSIRQQRASQNTLCAFNTPLYGFPRSNESLTCFEYVRLSCLHL